MESKDILKKLRIDKNITQKEASEKIGVSYSAYQKYESGERELGANAVKKLADFYGVTTDYLLGRPEAKPSADPIDEFASKTNMISNEQAALKKWLSLDETKRKAVLDIMAEIVHEYESN